MKSYKRREKMQEDVSKNDIKYDMVESRKM